MKPSTIIDQRSTLHHLASQVLRTAFSGFTLGAHAQGGTLKLDCKIVGAVDKTGGRGWIDSPGLALQLLSGRRFTMPEDRPELFVNSSPTPGRFRTTSAQPVYQADLRLHVMTANTFDLVDLTAQIDDYFRGLPNTGPVVPELVGECVYLRDPVNLPDMRLRVRTQPFHTGLRDQAVSGYYDLTAAYSLRPIHVDYPLLAAIGYIINPRPGTTPPFGGGSTGEQPGTVPVPVPPPTPPTDPTVPDHGGGGTVQPVPDPSPPQHPVPVFGVIRHAEAPYVEDL